MWWYWQHYRTWVPYSSSLVEQIQSAFLQQQACAADGALFEHNDTAYNIDFFFDADWGPNRPHQFQVGRSHRHREVTRLPIQNSLQSPPEQTLRHIAFETLNWMADIQGKVRLIVTEQEAQELSPDYSRESLRRTAQELGLTHFWCTIDEQTSWRLP